MMIIMISLKSGERRGKYNAYLHILVLVLEARSIMNQDLTELNYVYVLYSLCRNA